MGSMVGGSRSVGSERAPSDLLAQWPGGTDGAVVVRRGVSGHVERSQLGELDARRLAWASVTKVAVAMAAMVAVEEGSSRSTTQRGLRARRSASSSRTRRASLPRRKAVAAPERTRRIYSNAGYEVLGDAPRAVERELDRRATSTARLAALGHGPEDRLEGSPAWGLSGPSRTLPCWRRRPWSPRLISARLAAEMRTVQFPALAGVLPGLRPIRPLPLGPRPRGQGGEGARTGPGGAGVRASVGHFGQLRELPA